MGWFDGKAGGLLGDLGASNKGMGLLGSSMDMDKMSNWDMAQMALSSLADGYAGYRGEKGGNVDSTMKDMQSHALRRSLMDGLSSTDPALRQKAYMNAALLGVDTKPFQQQQATAALPAFLNSMKPQQATLNSQSAPLPSGGNITTASINFEAPGQSFSDAVMSAPPELQAQYAPKLLDKQMEQQFSAVTPATAEQKIAAGLDPRTPAQIDPNGKISPITDPNQITAYQTQTLAHQKDVFGETQRHDRATEATAAGNAANNNPFGKGMSGKAYAILAAGAKDPKVRGTPEYMTAWQILSNPKVDPNTGTIVVPDLSAYQPPDGVARGQGGAAQQRMPSLQAFAPPNPSQADAASAGYANRLSDSTKQIEAGTSALSDIGQHARGSVPLVGNYLVSAEYQKGDQAQRNFINAQLRRESGAAISESEFANARKQYIPQPGDGPDVLAQKKANRDMAVRNMQLSAGNTLLPPGVIQNASPPRGAPLVPMEQGFGGPPPSPANLPRVGAPKVIRYDAQGNRVR